MKHRIEMNRRQLLGGAAATAIAAATMVTPETGLSALDSRPFSGQSVLITGTSSGFGRLAAEHFARLGAHVFATMRNLPRPEADELKALAKADNLAIEVIEIDVLDSEQVKAGVAAALKTTGGTLDILVNNAGVGITGPVEVQDMQATQLAFDTNVFGPQRMARAVLPAMRNAGSGHIFNVSSQLGRVIVPGAGHYSATKFALEAMSEQMAYEVASHNIGVTVIQPGGYPTKIWVNRNLYTGNLKARTSQERLDAYPAMAAAMGKEDGSSRRTDPMDVPRAMSEIAAKPLSGRPLRRAVHPSFRPQEAANAALAEAQINFLGRSAYGTMVKSVLERGTS